MTEPQPSLPFFGHAHFSDQGSFPGTGENRERTVSISPPSIENFPEASAADCALSVPSEEKADSHGMVLIGAASLARLRSQVVLLAKRYAADVSDLQGRMESVKVEAERRMALVIAYRERAKVYAELSRLSWWKIRRRRELLELLHGDTL